ncbi:MAG: MATE family efflux transporter [Candidatus Limisoma sp.]
MANSNNPHILGTQPIGKLLVSYSLPAIVGMTLTSLYNIIDSIFIGNGVGALAISGMAITFPLMNLLIAFCTLVGVGGATISSIRLGQKDQRGAEDILGNVAILLIINACFYGGVTLLFLDDILRLFGASDETLPYARDFMQIILAGSPISYSMIGLSNIMRATGYPKKAMLSSVLTVVCNVIFAPIFIFGFEWGIRGAAIATVASQAVGLVWVLCHFLDRRTYIRFHRASLHLRKRLIKNIFSIGMSPFFMNVCACLVTIFINNRLLTYGNDYSVGAFGIVNRMQMLFVMVVMGIAQGMQPIVGYNYGASLHDRVRRALRYGIIAGVAVTTVGCILGTGFPSVFVGMFTDDPMLVPQSEFALRVSVMMFPFVGAQIITCQFFQSIGKAKAALFLSLSRQLVFLLPGLALLPLFFGVEGIWYSMPVSDLLATILAIWLLVKAYVDTNDLR